MSEFLRQVYFYLVLWDQWVIPPIWLILEVGGIAAAIHALLNKRDPRAALGWTAMCLALPGIGAVLYLTFGVNRIVTRAQEWQEGGRWDFSPIPRNEPANFDLDNHLGHYDRDTFEDLEKVALSVTGFPLLSGNVVEPLFNGEGAYPEMLKAIEAARDYILLGTYIFESNDTGRKFLTALKGALDRGIRVQVLVDGVGNRYSKPRIQKLLKKNGIPHVLFLPFTFSPRSIHMNLRTHRKILLVDGKVGFTGGMNIGDRHLVDLPGNPRPTQDIHFKIQGPVLRQLRDAFLLDWHFSTKEYQDQQFSCDDGEKGEALCRGVVAGPNEDFEKLLWIIGGTFNAAKRNLRIMTPYFIPDRAMISGLCTAALRGVKVEIILPEANNIPYVKWASQALFEELLNYDIKVYYQPAPFAHSKFLLVDDFYALIGSANLDPRSLRLNFEFNMEVYDFALNEKLTNHFKEVRGRSKAISLEYLTNRSFPERFRDSVAKLFSPYL